MLAYIDAFVGIVPCKVISIDSETTNGEYYINYVKVKVTARNNKAYKCGEELTFTGRSIIPRHALKRSKYGFKIMPYSWLETAPQFFKGKGS